MIDWSNPGDKITPHFSVGEATSLRNWNRLANEDDDGLTVDIRASLLDTCVIMEAIRAHLGSPILVHCMFRSEKYNTEQGIHPAKDVHSMGMACDFNCPGVSIQEVKDKLEPVLEKFNIRMEKGTTTWVHIDTRQPGPSGRYFTA